MTQRTTGNKTNYTFTYVTDYEGSLQINLIGETETITQFYQVNAPYITTSNNLATAAVDVGSSFDVVVTTLNPQGKQIQATSVSVDVYSPDNSKKTIDFDKVDNYNWHSMITFSSAGAYIFKIHPSLDGYRTDEKGAIVQSLAGSGIPYITYIWVIAVLLYAILWVRRRIFPRRKKK